MLIDPRYSTLATVHDCCLSSVMTATIKVYPANIKIIWYYYFCVKEVHYIPDSTTVVENISNLTIMTHINAHLKVLIHVHEPPHNKTNKMTCVPSKDSDQSGHPPSMIRVYAVHSMGS